LLLILPDTEIVRLVDELIWNRVIEVPTGEVRSVDASKRLLISDRFSASLELSSLGVRISKRPPILLFRSLLWNAYVQNGETTDLDWRLQKPKGVATQDALMAYLRKSKPPTAIDTLVLTSPRITQAIAQNLETSIEAPDEHARVLLEWKLGFDLPREDRRMATIRRVLDTFHRTLVRIGVPQGDDDRQAIRGAGVNAFVELEGFLDELIAYVVWVLYSDHPRATRFTYSRSAGAVCVPLALGAELTSGNEMVRWSATGNTLGTCVRYIQRLNEWLSSLPMVDRAALLRPAYEVHDEPSDAVTSFPFRHVQFWADANPSSLSELASVVNSCAAILNKAEVASVINGIEHYREPHRFPATERIVATVEALNQLVDLIDEERLIPKLYWFSGSSRDAFINIPTNSWTIEAIYTMFTPHAQ
jgi:hypothetical protein